MGLRFRSNIPDLPDAFSRREAAVARDPEVGDRVKIVSTGSRYNHKDFADTFKEHNVNFIDELTLGSFATVLAVTPHFKKTDMQVYLVKFDGATNGAAIMARKGIETAFWEGGHVTIASAGAKYAARDFHSRFPSYTIVDECRKDAPGVILRVQPHYKNANIFVYLVAINSKLDCVVMNPKGLAQREVQGLKEYTLRKEREEKEAKEAAAKAASEAEAGEKREVRPC